MKKLYTFSNHILKAPYLAQRIGHDRNVRQNYKVNLTIHMSDNIKLFSMHIKLF